MTQEDSMGHHHIRIDLVPTKTLLVQRQIQPGNTAPDATKDDIAVDGIDLGPRGAIIGESARQLEADCSERFQDVSLFSN